MLRHAWIAFAALSAICLPTDVNGQVLQKVQGVQASDLIDLDFPFHIGGPVGNWAGVRLTVNIDATEVDPGVGVINVSGTANQLPILQGSTPINNLDTAFLHFAAGLSGVPLVTSDSINVNIRGLHVINSTTAGNSLFDDVVLGLSLVQHVRGTAVQQTAAGGFILGQNVTLLASDHTAPAGITQWNHIGTTVQRFLPASAFIARQFATIGVGLDHPGGGGGVIPEPASVAVWGLGCLCGMIGLVSRRRRLSQS